MAITSQSALLAALPGQRPTFLKIPGSSTLWPNNWISLWKAQGNPIAGAAPGSTNGVVPTAATAGALPFTNAGGSNKIYLGRAMVNMPTAGMLVIYDRLLASSGFGGTGGAISPASPATVNRTGPDDGGAFKNELWLESYTTTAVAQTVTVTYTDQNDNTGNVSGTVTLPIIPNVMVPVPLAAGDTGVKSIQTVTLGGATFGDFGLTILRRLAEIPIPVGGVGVVQDALMTGFASIPANACLAMMLQPLVASPGTLVGSINLPEG
jgi:hypothetical protein